MLTDMDPDNEVLISNNEGELTEYLYFFVN